MFCARKLCMNYVTDAFLLVCSSVSSKHPLTDCVLCMVKAKKENKNIQQRTLSGSVTIPFYNYNTITFMVRNVPTAACQWTETPIKLSKAEPLITYCSVVLQQDSTQTLLCCVVVICIPAIIVLPDRLFCFHLSLLFFYLLYCDKLS